jgi:hypothetical protein
MLLPASRTPVGSNRDDDGVPPYAAGPGSG